MVAALGGDEFAIVARELDARAMRVLAERALEPSRRTSAELRLPGFKLTASAGWALYPDDIDSVDGLLTVADLPLREAKVRARTEPQSPLDRSPELAPLAVRDSSDAAPGPPFLTTFTSPVTLGG